MISLYQLLKKKIVFGHIYKAIREYRHLKNISGQDSITSFRPLLRSAIAKSFYCSENEVKCKIKILHDMTYEVFFKVRKKEYCLMIDFANNTVNINEVN